MKTLFCSVLSNMLMFYLWCIRVSRLVYSVLQELTITTFIVHSIFYCFQFPFKNSKVLIDIVKINIVLLISLFDRKWKDSESRHSGYGLANWIDKASLTDVFNYNVCVYITRDVCNGSFIAYGYSSVMSLIV